MGAILRVHGWPLVVIVLSWLFYAGWLLSWRTNLYLNDIYCNDLPRRIEAARMIRAGEFPHWVSQLNCGFPLFADGQTAVLYPFFLVYVISPTPEGHDLFMALHYLLVALFTYLLLVSRSISPWGSVIGAVTFMASSFLQSSHFLPVTMAAATWLPLSLYLIGRASEGRRRAGWLCAIVNGVALCAGHIHLCLISYTLQGVWLVYCFATQGRYRQGLVTAMLAFVLPLGLCAIQILPNETFLRESDRGTSIVSSELQTAGVDAFRLRWRHIWTFFWPDLIGTPWTWRFPASGPGRWMVWWEVLVFFHGFAAIVLAPIAIGWGRPRRDVWFWLTLLVTGLALAGLAPIWQLMLYIPPYNLFRWPTRFLLLTSISLSVLVAYGADEVFRRVASRWGARRPKLCAVVQAAIVVLAMLGVVHRHLGRFVTERDFFTLASPQALALLSPDRHVRLLTMPAMMGLHEHIDDARQRRNATALSADYSLLHHVPVTSVHDQGYACSPRAMAEIARSGNSNYCRITAATHVVSPEPLDQINIPGREFVLAYTPIPSRDDLEEIANSPAWLYRYKRGQPRAWMVYNARTIADRQERLDFIRSGAFDPTQEVVVEESMPAYRPPQAPPRVTFRQPFQSRIECDVETDTAGLLVVADYDWPEFRATVDGKPVKIRRANHAFRTVEIPAGRHHVVMRIVPRSFYQGAAISALCLILVAVGLLRKR